MLMESNTLSFFLLCALTLVHGQASSIDMSSISATSSYYMMDMNSSITSNMTMNNTSNLNVSVVIMSTDGVEQTTTVMTTDNVSPSPTAVSSATTTAVVNAATTTTVTLPSSTTVQTAPTSSQTLQPATTTTNVINPTSSSDVGTPHSSMRIATLPDILSECTEFCCPDGKKIDGFVDLLFNVTAKCIEKTGIIPCPHNHNETEPCEAVCHTCTSTGVLVKGSFFVLIVTLYSILIIR